MQGDNLSTAVARNRLDPEVLPFLAMLTAGFSLRPVLVTGFGNPTYPLGKFSAAERFPQPGDPPQLTISPDDPVFAAYPCLTEDENAFVCYEGSRTAARRRPARCVLVVLGRLSRRLTADSAVRVRAVRKRVRYRSL